MFYAGLGVAGQGYQYATGGTQYVNGQIPSAAVTPFAKALLSYLPSPTNTNTYNNYVVLHPESVNKDKGDVKVDWTPKENLRLFARYSQARFNAFDPGTIPGVAGGDGDGNVRAPMKQIVAGATWTLSPVSVSIHTSPLKRPTRFFLGWISNTSTLRPASSRVPLNLNL